MAVDGLLYHKVPLGRLKKLDATPLNRGKQGIKCSLLTDVNELPLLLTSCYGANTHDIKLVAVQTCRELHICL